jgi:hypothetical protein
MGKLKRLITAWRSLVDNIERGYNDTIYEYDNDLSVRDVIFDELSSKNLEARKAVGPDFKSYLELLSQTDTRFMELTFAQEGVPSGSSGLTNRYPKRPGAELESDMAELSWRPSIPFDLAE